MVVVHGEAARQGSPLTDAAPAPLRLEQLRVLPGGDAIDALHPGTVGCHADTGFTAGGTAADVPEPHDRLTAGAPAPTLGPVRLRHPGEPQGLRDGLKPPFCPLGTSLDRLLGQPALPAVPRPPRCLLAHSAVGAEFDRHCSPQTCDRPPPAPSPVRTTAGCSWLTQTAAACFRPRLAGAASANGGVPSAAGSVPSVLGSVTSALPPTSPWTSPDSAPSGLTTWAGGSVAAVTKRWSSATLVFASFSVFSAVSRASVYAVTFSLALSYLAWALVTALFAASREFWACSRRRSGVVVRAMGGLLILGDLGLFGSYDARLVPRRAARPPSHRCRRPRAS